MPKTVITEPIYYVNGYSEIKDNYYKHLCVNCLNYINGRLQNYYTYTIVARMQFGICERCDAVTLAHFVSTRKLSHSDTHGIFTHMPSNRIFINNELVIVTTPLEVLKLLSVKD